MKKNKTQNQKGEPKQAIAQLRYLRIAPRKMRLIGAMIKKMSVNEAEAQLITHARRPAEPLLKLLRSAVENAKGKNMDIAKTIVWEVRTDKGPALKRMMPRAQGRGTPIHKDTSHVLLVLQETENVLSSRFVANRKKKESKEEKKSREAMAKEKSKDQKERPVSDRANVKKEPAAPEKGFTQKVFRRKSV
jgi:large subunit ribosomal protein L22